MSAIPWERKTFGRADCDTVQEASRIADPILSHVKSAGATVMQSN